MKLRYLSAEDILRIHSIVLDETGGSHGVRDQGVVFTLENLPRQSAFEKELYPTIFEKAGVYSRSIILNHPFVDGNKRTGVTSASVFLEDNGFKLTAKEGELEKFAIRIILEKLEISDIADWFKKHSKKIK